MKWSSGEFPILHHSTQVSVPLFLREVGGLWTKKNLVRGMDVREEMLMGLVSWWIEVVSPSFSLAIWGLLMFCFLWSSGLGVKDSSALHWLRSCW